MNAATSQVIAYKRSRFSTRLPVSYLYSPSHAWLFSPENGLWRVGLTKFATRMLGEMVDHGFETGAGQPVALGTILGWVEGFKAISDLYCAVEGEFLGGNPALDQSIQLVSKDPYGAGWLYEARGTPDPQALGVEDYMRLLDKTIDRILATEHAEGGQGPAKDPE